MTDVEIETRNFLRELDTFGQPPPPQRIISDADSRSISKDFELKLHHINLDKQRLVQNGTSNVRTGTFSIKNQSDNRNKINHITIKNGTKDEITRDEIKKLKEQVVSATRPLNPWYEHQHQSPTVSSDFARRTAKKNYVVDPFKLPVKQTTVQYLPINVATVSGENTVYSVANAKKSSCNENLSSVSPASASSNTETSHSSISTTESSVANSIDPIDDNHRSMPYANAKGSFAPVSSVKTYYHSGPPLHRRPQISVSEASTRSYVRPSISENSSNKTIHLNEDQPVATAENKCLKGSTVTPSWRKQSMDSVTSTDSGVSIQRKKYEEITNSLEKQLNMNRKQIGICGSCDKAVLEETDVTCALGQLYHQKCFTCDVCGRTLRGKKFYKTRGKTYCEEDYLYIGVHETAERCAACSHLIVDMVLQALGKSYHPRCFRCEKCKTCLDGVPFALDSEGHVFCTEDYHKLFAPRCAACRQPIMPINGDDETVRVVAINRDYHVECYACEGCGIQLTDEPESRCYPLNEHLLCKSCHIHWARTGGDTKPITDL